MALVGEPEGYHESRLRERRLRAYANWNEIEVRLQHRWPPDRVIRWHQEQWPGAPYPPKTTLFRYLRSKPPGWFICRLAVVDSGTQSGTSPAQRQLVLERQSELIESQFMRLSAARKFESEMGGLLIPEVTRNYELSNRLLVEHFRVSQESGVEPKHGSMSSAGAAGAEAEKSGEGRLAWRIADLPKEDFLKYLHDHNREQYELHKHQAPPARPRGVIDVRAQRVEPDPVDGHESASGGDPDADA